MVNADNVILRVVSRDLCMNAVAVCSFGEIETVAEEKGQGQGQGKGEREGDTKAKVARGQKWCM